VVESIQLDSGKYPKPDKTMDFSGEVLPLESGDEVINYLAEVSVNHIL